MEGFVDTEYGRQPSYWGTDELGQISEVVTDGAHRSPKETASRNLMPSVKDMQYDRFNFSQCKTISDEDFEDLVENNCSPKFGDIIISKDGANCLDLIFVYKQPETVVLLSSLAIVRLKNNYFPDFYRYFLLSPNAQFLMRNNYVSGSAIPRVVLKDFKTVPVPIPPIEEQISIASILSSLDDKIDLLHRQNKTLEQLAETLFRQWFIEEAKEDWKWHQLGEFIEVMRGLSYNGAGLSEKGNGVPMHNLNSVYEGGGYKYDGIKYYKGDYKDRHLVSPGDVIVTNTEQGHEMLLIGYPALVPKYFGTNGIFTQHVYKLRMIQTVTEPFIYHLLKTWDVREQIAGATNGSTVNMLPKDGIEWAKFKLPPVELINRFTETVRPMIAKQETNYEQIQKLTSLRDTLLPKLMSGEVRVEL